MPSHFPSSSSPYTSRKFPPEDKMRWEQEWIWWEQEWMKWTENLSLKKGERRMRMMRKMRMMRWSGAEMKRMCLEWVLSGRNVCLARGGEERCVGCGWWMRCVDINTWVCLHWKFVRWRGRGGRNSPLTHTHTHTHQNILHLTISQTCNQIEKHVWGEEHVVGVFVPLHLIHPSSSSTDLKGKSA